MVQRAAVVVEPEQQRADERCWTVLVPAEARDHAIRAPRVLDLHHRALAGLIGHALVFGDNAVKPGAFDPSEPLQRTSRPPVPRRRANACGASPDPLPHPGPASPPRAGTRIAPRLGDQVET